MRILNIAMLASLLCSATTHAQVAPAPPAVAPVKEKKICRSEVPVGSIMAKRVCLTKARWKSLEGRNGEAAATALDYVRARSNAAISVEP